MIDDLEINHRDSEEHRGQCLQTSLCSELTKEEVTASNSRCNPAICDRSFCIRKRVRPNGLTFWSMDDLQKWTKTNHKLPDRPRIRLLIASPAEFAGETNGSAITSQLAKPPSTIDDFSGNLNSLK